MTTSTTNQRLLSSSRSSLLLLLILAANNSVGCDGFTIIPPPSSTLSASSAVNHYQTYTSTTNILHAEKDASNNDDDADNEPPTQQPPPQQQTPQQQEQQQAASSDLKALLPKPAIRPLQLDKFGRRIYRMDDDTTVHHTKGNNNSSGGGVGNEKSIGGDRASTDYASSSSDSSSSATPRFGMGTEPKSLTRQNNPPPEQMRYDPVHDANFVNNGGGGGGGGVPLSELLTDSKQLAGDKSKETFDAVSSSTDLKSLLPKQKMRFMKLDKFGRRVQRMEDDGTVSYTKSRVVDDSNNGGVGEESGEGSAEGGGGGEKVGAIRGVKSTSSTGVFTSGSEVEQPQPTFKTYVPSTDTKEKEDVGQSLSKLLTDSKQLAGDKSKETFDQKVSSSTDLKALLPTQKMRFMKLDKFGRRVQRMEDDGTVSYTKSRPGDESGSSASMVDLGTEASTTTSGGGGGGEKSGAEAPSPSVNLKDLAGISKRPVFTKLDFKGGSVPDDRREKKSPVDNDVEEEAAPLSLSGLRKLALSSKRPTFTKLDFHGTGVADERRIPKDTTAAAEVAPTNNKSNLKDLLPKRPTFTKLDFKGGNVADERRMKKSSSSSAEPVGVATTTSSLKTLLPERKFMWKKEERRRTTTNDFIGSVGGDFIAKTTTVQMRQKAMRDEVIASASAGSDEEGGNYSNLTNLLPKQKFVFRGGGVKGDDGDDGPNRSNEEEGSSSNLTDLI
jgi:hypothetical protein